MYVKGIKGIGPFLKKWILRVLCKLFCFQIWMNKKTSSQIFSEKIFCKPEQWIQGFVIKYLRDL